MGRTSTTAFLHAAFAAAVSACRSHETPLENRFDGAAPAATPVTLQPEIRPAPALARPQPRWGSADREPQCKESIFANLHPGVPVDALQLRVDVNDMYLPVEAVVFYRQGTPCSSAPDEASCMSRFANARPAEVKNENGLPLNQEYLVYSRGGEVGVVQGTAVGAFLAPIDNESEATATVFYSITRGLAPSFEQLGFAPGCFLGQFKPSPAGFSSIQENHLDGFCSPRRRVRYDVDRKGTHKVVPLAPAMPVPNCKLPPIGGRQSEGHPCERRPDRDEVGGFFAECAEMEAASVGAFLQLEAELRALAAPRALRRRALRSARDEASHARWMRALAGRFGKTPRRPRRGPERTIDVAAVAIENVVEGCVFEAWAALVATWQATHARDENVRKTLTRVAEDETRHAALSFDIARWLAMRCDDQTAVLVRAARANALGRLRAHLDEEPPSELQSVAGLPSAAIAKKLYVAWLEATERMAS